MAHDVFISYSSKDKLIADAICVNLEAAGVRCWIAPRDIAPGEDWPMAVTRAISWSRVMVLVFSASSNSSEDVSRELFLAANNKSIIIPFKIENVEPVPGKQYYLARTHWLDAVNPPTQDQIRELIDCVKTFLLARATPPVVDVQSTPSPDVEVQPTPPPVVEVQPAPLPNYLRYLWIPTLLVLLVCVIGAGVVGFAMIQGKIPALPFFHTRSSTPTSTTLPSPTVRPAFTPTFTLIFTLTPDYTAHLGLSGAYLYGGPGENYPATFTSYDEVTIIGKAYGCTWFKVVTNSNPSESGWVSAAKLSYTVKCSDVIEIPIPPTPMPTLTDTPLPPTKTPRPTATDTPATGCQVDSTITIDNQTGSIATIYLRGPDYFVFTLAVGSNTLKVCAGTYNDTIEGTCNGAPDSGSGTLSSGDDFVIDCK